MSGTRFNARTMGLITAETLIVYASVLLALYLRLGTWGAQYQLDERNAWMKIGLASLVCIVALYFYDLYDFTVMSNRRELMLRLVQALGIAWALLALLFY